MRSHILPTLVLAGLFVTACGGGGGAAQGDVADLFIELAGDEGITLDKACVEEAAAGLSDDDAEKIAEAGTEGDPDVSPAASAVAAEMFNCVDAASYVDNILEQFSNDASIDTDCLREQLKDLETAAQIDDKVIDAALACSS